jgi:hypothetical protein
MESECLGVALIRSIVACVLETVLADETLWWPPFRVLAGLRILTS